MPSRRSGSWIGSGKIRGDFSGLLRRNETITDRRSGDYIAYLDRSQRHADRI